MSTTDYITFMILLAFMLLMKIFGGVEVVLVALYAI